jgi:mannose-6-phosphate isomerase
MQTIGLLKNTVQHYAWGSATAIPDLLNADNPSGEPWAELWMGAHPKAPSHVNYNGTWRPLNELIQERPHEILGRQVSEKYNKTLPYLFKVLAAAKPLSIQAHPNLEQAAEGFARENSQNIPLDAPSRNYRDNNHKPECICALSRFYALYGFRKIPEIIALMTAASQSELTDELDRLRSNPDTNGLKAFYSALMTMGKSRQKRVVDETLENIAQISDQDSVYWIKKLSREYPSDIGIISPMLLNLICLEPGQALFLPAGQLHAYLEGLGIELMANSDNVLRGGLTPKHIDLPELLKVVHFEPLQVRILDKEKMGVNETVFVNPAEEFDLATITVSENTPYVRSTAESAAILLCTDGAAQIHEMESGSKLKFKKGDSAIVPAAVENYEIRGQAVLFKASVPRLRMKIEELRNSVDFNF